jgi:outer membrane lipoprotein SlyB
MIRALAVLLAAALAAGCASPRPKFYPNDYYKTAGDAQAKTDTDECLTKAKAYIKEHPVQRVAKKVAWGAVVGSAIGAAVGLILGDFKGAIASGAAAGGIGGGAQSAADGPDAMVRAYTDRCLAEKGYTVLGWR